MSCSSQSYCADLERRIVELEMQIAGYSELNSIQKTYLAAAEQHQKELESKNAYLQANYCEAKDDAKIAIERMAAAEMKLAEAETERAKCNWSAPQLANALDQLTTERERNARLGEALKFYASNWRSDVYTGPTNELLQDFGAIARQALAPEKVGGE